ncbi:hypothetical protein K491DRAFT_720387 [Lophiostoma macrostomum CBS 122681]|uniref:Rhodopsin domain-containing protein n=1 Tax=Lophiostoma macrostomum CBS 122681 TaxID=1314788 RepID=A0A6A6SSU8_9PLEO|nr:hypothetical protein K491DRAFT_720387 [Lophiostoma macrostomum CBS 122681]
MSFTPYPGQEKDLRNVPIALTSIAVVLVVARLVTTYKNRGFFGTEDCFIVASVICLVVFCIILVQASRYGFGRHVKDIEATGGSVIVALKYYYMSQIFYKTNITLNKLAFLFLYLRVFAIPLFRKICLTMIYLISASGIAFVILTIFQCTPIEKAWLKGAVAGTCVNLSWFRWTWTAFNLSTDLLIFTLPMPVISRLQMTNPKKIGLAVVFTIGFFICLTTGLRMKTIVRAAHATEQTWDSCPANLWSFIEVAVGVICACLISLRKILSICWPDRLRKSKRSSYHHYGSGSHSQSRTRGSQSTKRKGPGAGSQKLDSDDGLEQRAYTLDSVSTFCRNNGTTYDPDGKFLGKSDVRVVGGGKDADSESQECIIEPKRAITVRRDVSVVRQSR